MSEGLKTQSDEMLMESYQNGNKVAFEVLFERHSGRVFGFLTKRLSNKKEADDLLQEVFFKLHRSKHLYNNTLPFSPWLFSITRSVLLDFAKKRKLEDPMESSELEGHLPESNSIESEGNDLAHVLDKLPLAQRQAISLRVYNEETFEEIATQLSTTPENARQLFSRGIKRLRMALGRKKG